MVSSSSRRRAVKTIVEEGLGRTAQGCRALGLRRSSYYHVSRRSAARVAMEGAIVELSEKKVICCTSVSMAECEDKHTIIST